MPRRPRRQLPGKHPVVPAGERLARCDEPACSRWNVASGRGKKTESFIEKEIAKARAFQPPLAEYVIATSLERDAKLQAEVRELSDHNGKKESFAVHTLFWEEIWRELSGHPDLLVKYYRPWLDQAAAALRGPLADGARQRFCRP